ncbi:hypothetical protein VTN00DRAFT_1259 [Thermoascus crustaceus]|uniref:uncharacterized protein n=1 Tax=Thermoascus crustaceus TaxID=5088 RepID=UPI0037440540
MAMAMAPRCRQLVSMERVPADFLQPSGADGSIRNTVGESVEISWNGTDSYDIFSLGIWQITNDTISWLLFFEKPANSIDHPTHITWTVSTFGYDLDSSSLFQFCIFNGTAFGAPVYSPFFIIDEEGPAQSTGTALTATTTTSTSHNQGGISSGNGSLSSSAKAGIGVGVTLGAIAIAAIGWWWFFFLRRRKRYQDSVPQENDTSKEAVPGGGDGPQEHTEQHPPLLNPQIQMQGPGAEPVELDAGGRPKVEYPRYM